MVLDELLISPISPRSRFGPDEGRALLYHAAENLSENRCAGTAAPWRLRKKRKPDEYKAKQLKAAQPHATITTNADAARDADVVVLSTPWSATESAIRECGNLTGKIVIDATNPIKVDFSGLDRGFNTSGGEQVARWAAGAQVFKTMNQIGYALKDHPALKGGAAPVMFVAGDGQAKPKVLQLVTDLGFEAIDAEGLEYARLLEPCAMLWIHLALGQGLGRDIAFGLLRKP